MTIPYLPCTSPEVGRLLSDYVADLLDDSKSESVERHLVDCSHCKGHYLTVLRVRREAGLKPAKMMGVNSQNGRAAAKPAPPAQPAAAFATAATVKRKGKASGGP